ncbi:MAG: DUF1232 domain-containing protein [Candidatus Eremiobacteraeota bacterium]|nr:DUF1232 domain-containing protein [Candidatus Eremiobacteraeota bacterium]MBV8365432.1 DUF1232 domain-containing protein [Candidatus Eremiobacteraeota bacterium]
MALTLVSAARWALQFPKTALLASRLFLDTRISPLLKLAAAGAAIVVISPADLLGDIPVLGAVDDIALLMLLVTLFVKLCPAAIVREHQADVGTDPGATSWRPPSGPASIKNVTPRS